jgi:hypothetical protein
MVFFNNTPNPSQFQAMESTTTLKTNRVEPVLRDFVISFNVDVMGFVTIAGEKEEAIWSSFEYCWHSAQTVNYATIAILSQHIDSAIRYLWYVKALGKAIVLMKP